MKKIRSYLKHYLFGLFTSCWNAAIAALKINGGISIAAVAAPAAMPMPNLHEMIGIFVAAAAYEAIDYFGDHPLPTRIEDLDPSKATLATPRAAAPASAVVTPAPISSP